MSQNPTIGDAKSLAFKYRKTQVIILHFAYDKEQDRTVYGTASYGMTREKCDEAKEISDRIFDLVADPERWAIRFLNSRGHCVLSQEDFARAADQILLKWDDWDGEAGQASQVEQDSEAGDELMRNRLSHSLMESFRQNNATREL